MHISFTAITETHEEAAGAHRRHIRTFGSAVTLFGTLRWSAGAARRTLRSFGAAELTTTGEGTHQRRVRGIGQAQALTREDAFASGWARRVLRTAGVQKPGYAGPTTPVTPDTPVIGTSQRTVTAGGHTVSAREDEGECVRRFKSRGFPSYAANEAGGVATRTRRTFAAVPADSGVFSPDPFFMNGFANRAFEVRMSFAEADDTLRATPVFLLAARVLAAVAPAVRARMHSDLTAQVRAGDRLALWFLEQLSDAAVATDAVEDQARYLARLIDSLLATGQVSTYADAVQQLAAAVIATTEASAFALAALHDTAAAQDVVVDQLRLIARLVDTALAADEASTKQRMTVVLADESTAAGTLDTTLSAFQLLQQGAQAAITLQLDSGVYVAWTYNMKSAGVTRYENYPFNSFAKLGNDYYGLTSTGLYRLGGDTDDGAPIKAKLRLGMTDMGTRKMKRLPEVFMGYTGDGRMVLRVIYVDDKTGEKVGADYLMKPRPAGSKRESRFEPGKGLVATDFDFELENIDGADFSVTNIEFYPMVVDRRTRG